MDLNSIQDQIASLCDQESNGYQCGDYLSLEFQLKRQAELGCSWNKTDTFHSLPTPSCNSDSLDSTNASGKINECWREKICEWAYQVIDHFDFNREVVAISLSYLDRFLCTREVNKKVFQLAAMTSLYMAIKLYEPSTLRMSSFIELSRGYFTVEHIISMEETLLSELSWRMHPPTALTFVRYQLSLFDLCKINCSPTTRHDIGELARFLCELSICDYFYVTKKPSSIAVAAIITAVNNIDPSRLSLKAKTQFLASIRDVAKLEMRSPEVMECRGRLAEMYRQGSYGGLAHEVTPEARVPSPNCVAGIQSYTVTK